MPRRTLPNKAAIDGSRATVAPRWQLRCCRHGPTQLQKTSQQTATVSRGKWETSQCVHLLPCLLLLKKCLWACSGGFQLGFLKRLETNCFVIDAFLNRMSLKSVILQLLWDRGCFLISPIQLKRPTTQSNFPLLSANWIHPIRAGYLLHSDQCSKASQLLLAYEQQ